VLLAVARKLKMRKLLTLNKEGKLSLRAAGGVETEVKTGCRNVLLLIDTSGSMEGPKIGQAKSGAIEFAHSAMSKSYATALAVFADRVAMVCDPTTDAAHFTSKIARLDVGIVGGTTDLAAGLVLASKFPELSAIVIVTDGKSNDNDAALQVATTLKNRAIDIICIGTDDADRNFLKQLATRSDLSTHVSSKNLRAAITDASRFLPQG
jgi:Ca-activated chloride channel homolog